MQVQSTSPLPERSNKFHGWKNYATLSNWGVFEYRFNDNICSKFCYFVGKPSCVSFFLFLFYCFSSLSPSVKEEKKEKEKKKRDIFPFSIQSYCCIGFYCETTIISFINKRQAVFLFILVLNFLWTCETVNQLILWSLRCDYWFLSLWKTKRYVRVLESSG